MAIFNVSIYIETSIKGPLVKKAAGVWLVEYITSKDIPETRSGFLWREEATENALTLELLAAAFSILTKTCSVRVNTQCEHVLNAVRNGWLHQWKDNGWVNAKGKPVKNAELWQPLSVLMGKHLVEFDSGSHPYRLVMQDKIRKSMRELK